MSQPVTIENDAVRMEVWPQFGGKVSSVVDKADGFEMLFSYPAELPAGTQYDLPYAKGWCAGWDELFPGIAPGKYPRRPYDGIAVPDHGELWGLPTTAVPAREHGITTVWHGLRFGYRFSRKLYLQGPSVVAEYTLVNLAPFDFHFVWAQQAMLAMTAAEIEIPEAEARPAFRWSHDADGTDIDSTFRWPVVGEGMDVSRPADLPQRAGWKVYSLGAVDSPAVVSYPARGRGLRITYASDDGLAAYWGLWINTGGWATQKHFSVQPTTGRYDQIDRAIADGSAGVVAPMGRRDWSVTWALE
jgi:hypothetical protein